MHDRDQKCGMKFELYSLDIVSIRLLFSKRVRVRVRLSLIFLTPLGGSLISQLTKPAGISESVHSTISLPATDRNSLPHY